MSSDYDGQILIVAIKSILLHANNNKDMTFHILVSDGFDKKSQSEIQRLTDGHDARFYYVERHFKEVKSHVSWISPVTYYRLLIPDILQNEDKCLYLDTDIIVCEDLSELYNNNISEYCIAGVYSMGAHQKEHEEKYRGDFGFPSMKDYINAGVLLMNLRKMREENCSDRMMDLIEKDYPCQDQDIINKVCYGKIKALPFRYNTQTKYYYRDCSIYDNCYSREEIRKAWTSPSIIHYADWQKPWTSLDCPLADRWWAVCRGSDVEGYFYEKLKDAVLYHILFERHDRTKDEWEGSIGHRLRSASVVLIYGAGKTAVSCIEELKSMGLRADATLKTEIKENDTDVFCGTPLISVNQINKYPKDSLIIVATTPRYNAEITNILYERGYNNLLVLRDGKIGFS